MKNFTFDLDLVWLNLAWLIAAVVIFGVYSIVRRKRALRILASAALLPRLAPPLPWWRPLLRLMLVTAALLSVVIALLGPRWGEEDRKVSRRNVDVMILLDVSRSMLARDIAPNRLERAKLSIRDDLLPALGGDRVGLIAFAGIPVLKCPLTADYGFFRLVLDDVSTTSVARGGTLIGDAIRKAGDCFLDEADTHRIILLITDGEDQESFPVEAAAGLWKDHNAAIVAVALGDEREGARIPVEEKGQTKFLEYQGKEVWSKANFDDLRKIAAVSNLNAFVPVGTRNFNLGDIYRDKIVPMLNAKLVDEQRRIRQPSRHYAFALAALVLLLFESFLRDTARSAPDVLVTARLQKEAA